MNSKLRDFNIWGVIVKDFSSVDKYSKKWVDLGGRFMKNRLIMRV